MRGGTFPDSYRFPAADLRRYVRTHNRAVYERHASGSRPCRPTSSWSTFELRRPAAGTASSNASSTPICRSPSAAATATRAGRGTVSPFGSRTSPASRSSATRATGATSSRTGRRSAEAPRAGSIRSSRSSSTPRPPTATTRIGSPRTASTGRSPIRATLGVDRLLGRSPARLPRAAAREPGGLLPGLAALPSRRGALRLGARSVPDRRPRRDAAQPAPHDRLRRAAAPRTAGPGRGGGRGRKAGRGPDGEPLLVSLAEKLLLPLLVKLTNFVPEGGAWLNTQRPEWNDANNALAGWGLSMITVAYARRYLALIDRLLAGGRRSGCPSPSRRCSGGRRDLRGRAGGLRRRRAVSHAAELGRAGERHRLPSIRPRQVLRSRSGASADSRARRRRSARSRCLDSRCPTRRRPLRRLQRPGGRG